jgi:hypothetical protein
VASVATMVQAQLAEPAEETAPAISEPDLPLILPLPTPPTASPEPSPPVAQRSALPPLPTSKTVGSSDGSHATDTRDTKPDVGHARRIHHAPGLETVSHKTPALKR